MTSSTVSVEAQDALSPWWVRGILIVFVLGFAVLIGLTMGGYKHAPPIPGKVVGTQGKVIFTGADIQTGQTVFLKHGLMNNGSIWGHGAYLGPDFSATALHKMGMTAGNALAMQQFGQPVGQLSAADKAAIQAKVSVLLKTNRYDAATDTLTLTAPEVLAFKAQIPYWTAYFQDPQNNGGLKPDAITDPTEIRQFSAFVYWAAWASVANRPGEKFSYTNNFPYDPSVGNHPTSGTVLWSALSITVFLGGLALMLLFHGRFASLGWIDSDRHTHPKVVPGMASPSQLALVKFFVVVALLFLLQTLLGGAVAHSRADPGNFYGLPLDDLFPSNLLRTWHLQTAIFWIATSYVAAALYLGRTLRSHDPRGFLAWTNVLFVAFAIVIGASMLGEWAGILGLMGDWWFWFGNQGWEFLELGRFWQYLLVAGLMVWFFMLLTLIRPKTLNHPEVRPITRMFMLAALAIPTFYVPALFYGAKTNFTVVETWRFWIIHLWVEGFFEFFATTVVALTFYQLGLARRNTALRVIYLDAILYFGGGLVGTGHHWYFVGHTHVNMALSGLISVLEVVPLTLLTLDAWDFVKTTRGRCETCGKDVHLPHKWTFYFLMAVGFWNFLGAGVFGFLINMPIVSYYEVGTILTPNHGHAALMGVFGMLAIALMVFVLRQAVDDEHWPGIEKYIKVTFWGTNIGLLLMVVMALLPGGLLQIWDVLQNGYWHARSLAYTGTDMARTLVWLRMPGDVVFILFGSVPLTIAAIKGWLAVRANWSSAAQVA